MGLKDAVVIYAPHDYSVFRDSSKAWGEREIDILIVGGLVKRRENKIVLDRELEYANRLSKTGLNVVGIFLAKNKEERDLADKAIFPHYLNIPLSLIASFMGNSKILFHPSPLESCSLVIYEGLNAGMHPVVREAGACREQMDNVGFIYQDFRDAERRIGEILSMDYYNPSIFTLQGEKFDRKNTIGLIKEELKRFES